MGLFLAQYFGAKDGSGMKRSFALMLLLNLLIGTIFTVIALFWTEPIVRFYTTDEVVIELAKDYLWITAWGFIFNSISFAFAVAYRNIQKTMVPLFISIGSQAINVLFNWFLIFGIGPFPELGVAGAAIATLISTVAAAALFYLYALFSKEEFLPQWHHYGEAIRPLFAEGPLKKTMTLVTNELFFGVGMTLYVKVMNELGTNAYEGYRIAEIIVGFMLVVTVGLSTAVGAMVGEQLGKNDLHKAKVYGDYFLVVALIVSIFLAFINWGLSFPLVGMFNPIEMVKDIGILMVQVYTIRIVLRVFVVTFFALFRAGGDVKFVMFIDAGLLWIVGLPLAFIGYSWWGIRDIVQLFLLIQIEPLVRLIVAYWRYKKGTWIKNLIVSQ